MSDREQVRRSLAESGGSPESLAQTVTLLISVYCGVRRAELTVDEYRDRVVELIAKGFAALNILGYAIFVCTEWETSTSQVGDMPKHCQSCDQSIRASAVARADAARWEGALWLCSRCGAMIRKVLPLECEDVTGAD